MYRSLSCVVVVALSLGAVGEAFGVTITIPGDIGDGVVDVNGLPQDFFLPQLRVGVGGNNVRGLAVIFFFALPTVPSPASIVGAQLDIAYLGISQGSPGVFVPPEFNVDLFGIGARSSPTILGSDYHDGSASLSTDMLIAERFVTPSTLPGTLQAADSSLLDFITSLYQPDGTPTAAYVVFRANPDVDLPPFSGRLRGYELASANNASEAFVPRLSLTVASVPEPGTLTLIVVGAVVLTGCGWCRGPRRRAG